jgi:hypothetical protein
MSVGQFLVGNGRPGAGPDPGERLLQVGHGRAADLDPGVAPGFDAPPGITQPAGADTQAADETGLAVDGDGLAVIARHPAERAVQLGRVEAADLGAGGPQLRPQPAGTPGAQPVVQHPDLHAVAGLGRQSIGELPAHVVVAEDVALEVDVSARPGNRLHPGRVVLGRVLQQPHPVPGHQGCPCRAREGLLGQLALWVGPLRGPPDAEEPAVHLQKVARVLAPNRGRRVTVWSSTPVLMPALPGYPQ